MLARARASSDRVVPSTGVKAAFESRECGFGLATATVAPGSVKLQTRPEQPGAIRERGLDPVTQLFCRIPVTGVAVNECEFEHAARIFQYEVVGETGDQLAGGSQTAYPTRMAHYEIEGG